MAISAISIAALVNKHNTLSTIIALEGGHYWHVWNIAVPIIKPSLKAAYALRSAIILGTKPRRVSQNRAYSDTQKFV